MAGFRAVLLVMMLGQTQAWERSGGKFNMRCEWMKKEMAKGAKPWLTKQGWYARVARSCGMPVAISDSEPVMNGPKFELPGRIGLQPQKLVQLAKMAMADPASQNKAKAEAMRLAQMAKMALMTNPEAQAGVKKGMELLKQLEEKKRDGSWKKDAELLANKATGDMTKQFGPEIASKAVEKAHDLLQHQDIKHLGDEAMAFLNKAMSKQKDLTDETSKFAQMAVAKMNGPEGHEPWEQAMPTPYGMPAMRAMPMPQYGMPAMRAMPAHAAAPPTQYEMPAMSAMPTRAEIQV
eukprot:TRINITY_DN45011_c0_g1_i1.p1 TRINITY_DN45011_c0_g1~~TRINITY_DN45011_c0_g1_i1.p1  ORF type:complete len:292 (-),score=76.93 TRINITY_DN45011_c0_g1_i1:154-1029(-)